MSWISVKDQPPPSKGEFLAINNKGRQAVVHNDSLTDQPEYRSFIRGCGCGANHEDSEAWNWRYESDDESFGYITHWKPLDEPPEK